jgi:hypothetical protein
MRNRFRSEAAGALIEQAAGEPCCSGTRWGGGRSKVVASRAKMWRKAPTQAAVRWRSATMQYGCRDGLNRREGPPDAERLQPRWAHQPNERSSSAGEPPRCPRLCQWAPRGVPTSAKAWGGPMKARGVSSKHQCARVTRQAATRRRQCAGPLLRPGRPDGSTLEACASAAWSSRRQHHRGLRITSGGARP